jgi:fructokinase
MARIGALEAGGTKMVLSVGTPEGEVLEREEIPYPGPA